MEHTVSIDRLTILGDEVKERFQPTLDNNHYGFIERDGMAQHPYKRNFYMLDGSLLQWTDLVSHKALRYEFNPNRVRDHEGELDIHRQAVYEILRTMKYPIFSRIDIAMDIRGVDLSQYAVVYDSGHKRNYWENGQRRLETLYLGAPNSDYRIRIYDKNLEQKIKEPGHWWRVEVQLRSEMCNRIISGDTDVFNGLKFVKSALKNIKDFRTRSAIYYLLDHPEGWAELSRSTKSRYKKILDDLAEDEEIAVDSLFKPHRERIKKELADWLLIGQRNNVI